MSDDPFWRDVLAGLDRRPKTLPATLLWDDAGAALFERVCAGPDYHVTRTETALLAEHAGIIAGFVGGGATVVEFGSGASRKVRLLLDAFEAPAGYVPIDIAPATVRFIASGIAADYPTLAVVPIVADYTQPLTLPPRPGAGVTLGFFPGHTIGTYSPAALTTVLRHLRNVIGGGLLLVGVDPTTDPVFLRRAYADPEGRMEAFHLNILARIRDRPGGDVSPAKFRHEARVFHDPPRVEAHLVATQDTCLRMEDRTIDVAAGESILTDYSFKYPLADFTKVAEAAGWSSTAVFVSADERFSLHLLSG